MVGFVVSLLISWIVEQSERCSAPFIFFIFFYNLSITLIRKWKWKHFNHSLIGILSLFNQKFVMWLAMILTGIKPSLKPWVFRILRIWQTNDKLLLNYKISQNIYSELTALKPGPKTVTKMLFLLWENWRYYVRKLEDKGFYTPRSRCVCVCVIISHPGL